MADKYALTGDWSNANTWSLTDGGDAGAGKPSAAEDAYSTSNSGNVTMDEDSAIPVGNVTMTGYTATLDIAGYDIASAGDITLDGTITQASGSAGFISATGDIVLTAGMTFSGANVPQVKALNSDAKNITTNSVSNFDFVKDSTGTLTAQDKMTTAAFDLVAGTLDMDSNDVDFDGALLYTGGTLSNSGKFTLTGSDAHNVYWNSSGSKLAEFAVDINATATLITGYTYCAKLSGDGTLSASGGTLYVYAPGDNFWLFTGTATADVRFFLAAARSTGSAISLTGGADLTVFSNNFALTADGGITIAGDFYLEGAGNGQIATLTMGANGFAVSGTGYIGDTAANDRSGSLNLGSGVHSIADLQDGNAANLNNALDFGTGSIQVSGTLDGDNITMTNTSGVIVGGTVNNCNVTGGIVHLYPAAAGSGNTNVTEVSPSRGLAYSSAYPMAA